MSEGGGLSGLIDLHSREPGEEGVPRGGRDEEEGHTGSTAADGDHVVIRTNGHEMEATQFSKGEPAGEPTCPAP